VWSVSLGTKYETAENEILSASYVVKWHRLQIYTSLLASHLLARSDVNDADVNANLNKYKVMVNCRKHLSTVRYN